MARVDDLIEQIQVLEEEMQLEFEQRRGDFLVVMDAKRVRFSGEVAALRRSRVGLLRYVTRASLLSVLTAPLIYLGFIPLLLLDAFLFLFQSICFPAYRIPRVRRADHLALDRGDLPYLNVVERVNCFYCGYANGLASYFREIAARTEQYWCPIKHARRIIAAHEHYPTFFEYGDADSYRLGLERMRSSLADVTNEL